MTNIGGSFKKAREAAGLSLEKVAADTRISTRFLLAIESDEFHLLPGGIFNRGFIRAYAERLGINPDQAVGDYDHLSAANEEPLEVLRKAERASTRRTERNFYPIAAGILVLLIGGFYFANRRYATKPAATVSRPAPQPAAPPATTPSISEQAGPATDPATAAPSESIPIDPPTPLQMTIPSLVPASAPAPAAAPATAPAPELQASQGPVTPPITAATILPTPPATATATPADSSLVLDVDIKDVTWMRIAADGAVVLAENIQPGMSRRFSAQRLLEITIGNAAGVSLKINGRDMGQLGTNGRVREFRITPENAARIQG